MFMRSWRMLQATGPIFPKSGECSMTSSLPFLILRDGLQKGISSLLRLAKFVLPTVFLLALLQHSPLFPLLATWLSPLTAPLGLPGDAALVLLTGLLVNKFAAIAGLLLLPLSAA